MIFFQQFYLDKEKDIAVDLHMEGDRLFYTIRTPNHHTGNLITNLALAAGNGGWLSRVSSADKKAFRDRLSLLGMGLEDRMRQPVGLLSGGQRQALTLLMATYHAPQVLLDEHTAALDPGTAEKVLELTRSIVEDNHITCLMITHNMQSALDLGNRTLMMDRGRVIYDVTGEDRANLTISDLTDKFRQLSGRALDNDRMLLGVQK